MSFVGSNILAGASGQGDAAYKIERSLRFNSVDSAHLSRDFASSNRKTWTWSSWFKLSKLDRRNYIFTNYESGGQNALYFEWTDTNKFRIGEYTTAWVWQLVTAADFRDLSAWYHLVLAVDTTQSTAANRIKVYVNGEQLTSFSPSTYPTQNKDTFINQNIQHTIGRLQNNYADFYLADVHFVDGQALAPTDFAEYDDNNVWQPKGYTHAATASTSAITNVSSVDNTRTISVTASGWQNINNAIDSSDSSVSPSSNNTPGTITFSPALVGVTKVRAKTRFYGSGTAKLYNGSTQVHSVDHDNNNATQYYTIYEGPPIEITQYWQQMQAYNSSDDFWALEINDTIVATNTNGGNLSSSISGAAITLTTTNNSNYSSFLVGDSVNNGAQISAINSSTPSITVNTGSWNNGDFIIANNNSFYLNFSDNSSNAALGFDARYSGTRYSLDAQFGSSGSTINTALTAAFDGSTATAPNKTNADTFTWAPSGGYAYTQSVEVYLNSSLGTNEVTFNGTTATTGTGNRWATLATGSGTITNITTSRGSSSNAVGFSAVRVDGTILTDPAGANDWTVNNLVAAIATSSFTVLGNASNSGSTSATNVSSLSTISSTPATSWPANGVTYNHLTADFQSVGTYNIHADPFLSDSTADIVVFVSDNGTSWTTISKGQSPYSFSGRYIQWVRAGSGYGAQNLNAYTGAAQDSLIDTPTNYEAGSDNPGGNYCGMNPLDMKSNVATHNGNMEVKNATPGWSGIRGTMGVNSGKWYYELKTESSSIFAGIATSAVDIYANAPQDTTSVMDGGSLVYCDDGKYLLDQGGSSNRVNYGSALANGDFLGVAFDLDGNTVQFYKNGSAVGSIDISSSPLASNTVFPYLISYNNSTTTYFNFGQRPFAYTPPTGYKALCTTNLPDPTIADGSTAMDVNTFTGNHPTGQSITGLNFSPDLVWLKDRAGSNWHYLFDTIRGTEKALFSNATNAEGTYANTLTSFNSDGFTLGSDNATNQNGNGYVSWTWDAGTSTVSNTDGSITSSVRANPSAGFSIVSYTGNGNAATIGHGLNAAPELIIKKFRSATSSWDVYHASAGAGKRLVLNATDAVATTSSYASVNSSTFDVHAGNNDSGVTMIAYCFTPVAGYSAFGSYTGNGSSTDGPFVFTGFKVKFLLLKLSSASGERWYIQDVDRDFNPNDAALYADSSDSEYSSSSYAIDFLSNGFKVRNTNGSHNTSGATYIYAAFAEHPQKTARAR